MVSMHLRLRPQSHRLRVRSALPLCSIGVRHESKFLSSQLAGACWLKCKRVALSIAGFAVPLLSSGNIPH